MVLTSWNAGSETVRHNLTGLHVKSGLYVGKKKNKMANMQSGGDCLGRKSCEKYLRLLNDHQLRISQQCDVIARSQHNRRGKNEWRPSPPGWGVAGRCLFMLLVRRHLEEHVQSGAPDCEKCIN